MTLTSVEELLLQLRSKDVRLRAEGDRLRCNAPKGALSPALQRELLARKSEILAFLRDAHRSGASSVPQLTPVDRQGHIPLSFGQQRLWFLQQLEPKSTAYNVSSVTVLKGRVDVLQRALNELIKRHEILRTTYQMAEVEPVQVIQDPQPIDLRVVDLRTLSEDDQKQEMARLAREEARTPFDLAGDPIWRVAALDLGEGRLGVVMTIHHIATDALSLERMSKEIEELYRAFSTGTPAMLPDLPIQYADYAVWQQQWLEGEQIGEQLSYWRERLAGVPSALPFPTDRPRPPVQTHHGAGRSLSLPPSLCTALKALSQNEGTTRFMSLFAAFNLLLQRHTGQSDIVVGTPIAGRTQEETENVLGYFLNALALRTDLSGDPSFRELLGRVRETSLQDYAHQDLPFERILEELQPQRDLSRTPIFQIFFNMISLPAHASGLRDSGFELGSGGEPEAKFDITLYVRERGANIDLAIVYNTDLFDQDRMTELLDQYEHLLPQVVERPDERISRFSLVTSRARVLLPDPAQPMRADSEGAVHERFAEQAARAPERLSVVDREGSWTYRELEVRSNQLANYLLSRQIGRRDVVAIYGHRSASLVWAILGVLKDGAAFVILDPAHPALRIVDCLRQIEPKGWLQLEAAGDLPGPVREFVDRLSCPCRLVIPRRGTEMPEELSSLSSDCPPVTVEPTDLAYIAFTSGSTGKPKGILGEHRPLSHFLRWHTETFGLTEQDCFSMLSGLSHDPLLRDILAPLWQGATLCIPSVENLESPERLLAWMKQQQISVAHLTPAMGQFMADASAKGPTNPGDLDALPDLRYAFFGGDVLTGDHVAKFRELCPAATCVNFYGATETPQAMGCFVVADSSDFIEDDPSSSSANSLPLGKGIDDVQLLVLNSTEQLAGIGEVGEIHIRTPHLAKGYLGDEALTQERFIVNPSTRTAGDMLYKTGDLGRHLPNGDVQFIGRNDRQVKIRGFRVELGEIETVLAQQPGVREVVVLAREHASGDPRLTAHLVPDQPHTFSANSLRDCARSRLPDYMVPSAFVVLDAMPLTPNGKVDLDALPAPGSVKRDEPGFVSPQTPAETLLAQIWCDLLDLDRVSVHDNFFDVGGHSLLTIQVITRFEEATGFQLNPAEFFRQTLAQLAASSEGRMSDRPAAAPAEATAETIEPVFFGGSDRRLFGCFRFAQSSRNRGVVLCHPHAHEYLRCHRAQRLLAERLSMAGYPVLSFDYYGCGDSEGEYEEGRIRGWCTDVTAAVDAMKRRFRLDRVCLVGLRLGATMAMMVGAEREDVDAIALWDPIVRGSDVAGELIRIRKAQSLGRMGDDSPNDTLSYPLTSEMEEDLRKIDLMAIRSLSIPHVLVLETEGGTPARGFAGFMEGIGEDVRHERVVDARIWLREPFEAIVPQQTLQALVAWILRVCP